MTLANTLIGICWFIVVIIWIITGAEAKKSKIAPHGKGGKWIRFILVAGFFICFWIKDLRALNELRLFLPTYFIQVLSVALCMIGVSFAIWARLHLGRNWGMPMALKENAQLVKSGPYCLVRHPIYAGLCVAMVGSLLTAGILWAIWYALWTLYFLYSVLREEKLMLVQFPNEYPRYKEKTKMLIPFIL